jgi:hypothetical protein
MQRFLGTMIDKDGVPLSGVTINVKKGGTATDATLYADNIRTAKSNNFTNDSDATYEFYAANGRYDLFYTKAGKTFTDANSSDLVFYDPADDAAAVMCRNEFLAPYFPAAGVLLSDGQQWSRQGLVQSVTGDTTYRNGWLDVLEAGAVQGGITHVNTGTAVALNWVASTVDVLIMEMRVEKQGDAIAGTRRVGLGSLGLAAGDPTNGIYIRQIDAANAFLVCRSGGSEATSDLGQTLNNPTRIRVTITTSSVRPYVDDVAKTAVTTQIPTAILALSAGGGATASAAGLRLDYLNMYSGVRV